MIQGMYLTPPRTWRGGEQKYSLVRQVLTSALDISLDPKD